MFSARNGKELKNALKTASLLKDVSQIPKGRGDYVGNPPFLWEFPPNDPVFLRVILITSSSSISAAPSFSLCKTFAGEER